MVIKMRCPFLEQGQEDRGVSSGIQEEGVRLEEESVLLLHSWHLL